MYMRSTSLIFYITMATTPETILTAEQKRKFDDDGYLIIPNYFSIDTANVLKQRAAQLLEEFSLEGHPLTRFSTGNGVDKKHVGDDYFLESGDKIRFFFEEEAFDERGQLRVEKNRAINKIGHALHELDPIFRSFTSTSMLSSISRDLGFRDPRILQSMVIFKQPYIGAKVPVHQDSTFLYTEPVSANGLWFALEDCTEENGCLWFIPGSHKDTPVTRRFVRDPSNRGTMFIGDAVLKVDESRFVKEETPAGSLVIIHGSTVHKSGPNHSSKSRYIYTFHLIEGEAVYPIDNWLQPTKDMPFTKI